MSDGAFYLNATSDRDLHLVATRKGRSQDRFLGFLVTNWLDPKLHEILKKENLKDNTA